MDMTKSSILAFSVGTLLLPQLAGAQGRGSHVHPSPSASDTAQMAEMADRAMSGPMDAAMSKHMDLSPVRPAKSDDSVRAMRVAAELKRAIAKYQDTAVAVADGYKMFLPGLANQHVYHFTNYRRAFLEAFRFNAAEPTSLLYKRDASGKLRLVGAMYTMPKNAKLDRLNERVPLSVARWHKHVNWCVPKKGETQRWLEQKNGKLLFGPEGSIVTKAECDAARGVFHPNLFGWMLHANVYEGATLASIFGDDHGPGQGHAHP